MPSACTWLGAVAVAVLAVLYSTAGFAPPLHSVAWTPPGPLPDVPPNARFATAKLVFEKQFVGPESMVSDSATGFMYSGVLDGRIVGMDVERETWWTAFRFNASCVDTPGDAPYLSLAGVREVSCGRPLGMRVDPHSGALYVLESYTGLYRFARFPRAFGEVFEAPQLVSDGPSDGGRRIVLGNDLAVSSKTGLVYFTETQDRWGRYRITFEYLSARSSGRLLEYDPATGRTRTLADALRMPNGVSLSSDESKVFFAAGLSILAYDVRTGALSEVLGNLMGIPDNLRPHPTVRGRYLQAFASLRAQPFSLPDFLAPYPKVRDAIVALLPERTAAWAFERLVKRIGLVAELDLESAQPRVVSTWQDRTGRLLWLSEVHKHGDAVYIGSWHEAHLVKMDLADFLNAV